MTEPRGAWLRPRPTAPKPQQPSRSPSTASPTQTPKPSSPAPAPATAPTGNVWAARAAQRAVPAAAGAKREQSPASSVTQGAVAQGKHVPVNNFNENEVKESLGRGNKGAVYKVEEKTGGSPNADGAIMANGQNFFVELSKQVAALQKKK